MSYRISAAIRTAAIIFFGVAVLSSVPPMAEEKPAKKGPADLFAATYINTQNVGGSSASFIQVDEYSTDAEAKALAQTLQEKGQMEVFNAIAKLKKGFVRIGGSMGYPIAVARTKPTETGRTVFLVSSRPFQGLSMMDGTKASEYPFSLVILTLDKDNKGEGQIIGSAQIAISKEGTLDIKSLGTQPLRLLDVREQK